MIQDREDDEGRPSQTASARIYLMRWNITARSVDPQLCCRADDARRLGQRAMHELGAINSR